MTDSLDDLKELVGALKADRHAQKDKERRDAWTKYVSLTTILLAVLAAVATQRGGGYSSGTMKQLNEATFNQAEASDQWSYYQAKGIKLNLYKLEHERLSAAGSADPKVLATLAAQLTRYDKEQKEIAAEAKKFEAKRDLARAQANQVAAAGREMGLATSVFQIAIALGGITLIVKKRWLWFASMAAGVLAAVQMLHVIYAA